MAKKKTNSKKKWLFGILIVVILAVAGASSYYIMGAISNNKNDNVEINENQKEEERKEEVKQNNDQEGQSGGDEEKPKVVQYDGDNPNEAEVLTGAVTFAGVSNSTLMIRVNIDQYLENGECKLTLMRGGDTIYNSIASIIGGASTATCEGFDIPVEGLGGGRIEININLSADGRSGMIRGEVSI